jgi:hypothetical protein
MSRKPSRISYPTSSVQADRREGEENDPAHPRQPPACEQRYGLRLTQRSSRSHTLSLGLEESTPAVSCTALCTRATKYANSMHLNALLMQVFILFAVEGTRCPRAMEQAKSEQAGTGPLPAQTSTIRVLAWKVCKGNRAPSLCITFASSFDLLLGFCPCRPLPRVHSSLCRRRCDVILKHICAPGHSSYATCSWMALVTADSP